MRRWIAIATLALAAACKDDGGANDTGGASTGDEPTTTSGTPMTSVDGGSTTDLDCIAGSEDCACLDQECVGVLSCVEGICKPPPQFDPQQNDVSVLGGLVVPIGVDVVADSFEWSQVSGPPTEIIGEGPEVLVPVPADATPGDIITLRINAVRNTIQGSIDVEIEVREPVFEDFLAGITDTSQLGTSEGLDFDGNGNMWVASSEGFVSRFGPEGQFVSSYDVGAAPVGIDVSRKYFADIDDDLDVLYIAAGGDQAVQMLELDNQQLTTLTDTLDGGGMLGTVERILPADNDDLFISTGAGGQILHFDSENSVTTVFTDLVASPSVLRFGPDANVIYVGTVGQVLRVPVLPDGTVGEVATYLDLGDTADPLQQVEGLSFDDGGNLWVTIPGAGRLVVAPYVGDGPTAPAREWNDVGTGISSFGELRHGRGGFGDDVIYWTNGAARTVGRLETGVRG